MTPRRNRSAWLVALVAVCSVHLGAPCGDPPPPVTPCMIRIEAPTIIPVTENYYVGFADILIDTEEEFQAYEFTLSWDVPALQVSGVSYHPEFDDDSQFSAPVTLNQAAGTSSMILDVRHGPSVTGTTRVASVVFQAPQGLPGTLSVVGNVAAPDGSLLTMTASPPVTTP